MNAAGKILIVDDHVNLAENMAEILQSAGYAAVIADSADTALAMVADGGICAVVTDFRLPGRSGAELIAELRRRGSNIPAVVMSAYTDDQTIASAHGAGAIEVLAKPVSIAKLMSVVEAFGRDEPIALIVEDNRALADNMAEILTAQGFLAVVSTNAREAFAERTRPWVAVIDFKLPDATGIEVALRLTSRDPRMRVLFVSAFANELRAQLAGPLADAETMEKPVDLTRLLSWVTRAFHDGHATRSRR